MDKIKQNVSVYTTSMRFFFLPYFFKTFFLLFCPIYFFHFLDGDWVNELRHIIQMELWEWEWDCESTESTRAPTDGKMMVQDSFSFLSFWWRGADTTTTLRRLYIIVRGTMSGLRGKRNGSVKDFRFLDASTHLFKLVCSSVRPSVTPLCQRRSFQPFLIADDTSRCPIGLVTILIFLGFFSLLILRQF